MVVSLERVLNEGGNGLINTLCMDMPWKKHSSNYLITTWNQNQRLYRNKIYLGDEDLGLNHSE